MSDLVVDLLSRRPPSDDDQPERLQTLLELLDRPDHAVPAIWVGGSHGRSSVVAMVAALLAALDITAGAATRPHLQDLRERLRIAGVLIPADTLRAQLTYLDPFLREVDTRFAAPLAFDEVLLAMGATWFADAPVDVAVHEGAPPPSGRRDMLVTLEPAGRAVVSTDAQRVAGADYDVVDREIAVGGQQVTLRGVATTVSDVYLPFHGRHQADNAALALAAVEGFLGFSGGLDGDLVRGAFARLRLPGRLEVVRRTEGASVLLDGARDATAATALAAALLAEFEVRHRVGVLGLCTDDPDAVLRALVPALDHVVVAPAPTPDATPTADVVAAAEALGVKAESAGSIDDALELASGVATSEDAVVVTGGLQTAGAARRLLGLEPVDDLLDRE
jgi:dihydrofolate synthase/folylpolyglutamate synthase